MTVAPAALAALAALAAVGLVACASPPPVQVPPPTTASPLRAIPSRAAAEQPEGEGFPVTLPAVVSGDDRSTFAFVTEGQGGTTLVDFGAGSIVFLRMGARVPLDGTGKALVFRLPPQANGRPWFSTHDANHVRIPTNPGPWLVWGNGKMAAREYFRDAFYLGKLQGSLPVAEHVHLGSWEIICANRAAGTFTKDGIAQRLTAGGCVSIPPGHKHSWTPDPGTSLDAVQVYAPPGPEGRFRTLAGAEQEAWPAQPGN